MGGYTFRPKLLTFQKHQRHTHSHRIRECVREIKVMQDSEKKKAQGHLEDIQIINEQLHHQTTAVFNCV